MVVCAANPVADTEQDDSMQDVIPSTTHFTNSSTPANAATSAVCSIPPGSLLIEAFDERSVRGSGEDGCMQGLDGMSDDGDGGFDDYVGDSDEESGHMDVQYCPMFSIC